MVRKPSIGPGSEAQIPLECFVFHDMREAIADQRRDRMAKVRVAYLFKWQDIEAKSDLERLRLVLDHLPDEGLMKKLEAQRDKGRNDYPVRPVWNSVLAGILYQHASVESLRRELRRNGELREGCGFDPLKGCDAVPPSYVYTRFLKRLKRCSTRWWIGSRHYCRR